MVKFQQPVNYSASNIRELRRQSGMSRREVVDKLAEHGLSLHQTSLRRIEEGQQAVKIEEAQAFAEIFNIDLADFITKPVDPAMSKVSQAVFHFRDSLDQLHSSFLVVAAQWNALKRVLEEEDLPPAERSDTVYEAQALADESEQLLRQIYTLSDSLRPFGIDSRWPNMPSRMRKMFNGQDDVDDGEG